MVHMVSLPSIHEGFPDLDFKDPPPLGPHPATRPQAISDHRSDRSSLHISHGRTRRSSYSSPKPYDRHVDYPPSPPSTRRRSSSNVGRHPSDNNHEPHYRDTSSRYLPQPSPRGSHPTSPSSARTFPPPPEYVVPTVSSRLPSSPNGTHSFDVLRSDPGTISLEHIASSKTLQHRGAASTKPASPSGIANGSAPAFRVTLTHPRYEGAVGTPLEVTTRSTSSRTFPHGSRSETLRDEDDVHDGSSPPLEYPSLVAFSMSDGSSVSKLTVDGNGRSHFEEVGGGNAAGGTGGAAGGATFRLDGRGKKHQCPQCSKRFNRPSSLRIHVNTHTGARPFQCPYPNCGREFNVNSNMRRHYRNHSIPATDEVHPPRHNSGRRPIGYPRPHPGRNAAAAAATTTTVFHVGAAGGGTPESRSRSSASDDDDEYDMDHGSASDFDEDGVEHHVNGGRVNYPTRWSRSPSPHHEWPPRGYDLDAHRARTLHASPCCNPHRQYPSPAYAQSYRRSDSEISTTLRPASSFH